MRRTRTAAATGLTMILAAGLLTGCQTGEDAEPAEPSTPATTSVDPTPTQDPTTSPEPSAEAPGTAVNGPNAIVSPTSGGTVAGPTVTVEGEGTGFEGTLLYAVSRAGSADVVAEGFTTAGANGEVGPYSFDVDLEPGEYSVQVWEPGMGEGDAGGEPRNLVEVTFTVS